jgi:hypothetical protein
MHFSMFLLYDNGAKPYAKNDKERYEEFKKITEKCKQIKNNEIIIAKGFNYEDLNNDGNVHQNELIARVPQIFLTYGNNLTHFEKVKKDFKELFEFFEVKILNEIREMIPKIEVKEILREFNQDFFVFEKIKGKNIEDCESQLKIVPEDENLNEIELENENSDEILENQLKNENFIEKFLKNLKLDFNQKIHAITSKKFSEILLKIQKESESFKIPTIFMKSSKINHENFERIFNQIDNLKADIVLVVECDEMSSCHKFIKKLDESTIHQVIVVVHEYYFDKIKKKIDDVISFEKICQK